MGACAQKRFVTVLSGARQNEKVNRSCSTYCHGLALNVRSENERHD